MFKVFIFILFSSAAISAQMLPKSERERIEDYGTVFVEAINSQNDELHTKTVIDIFSQASIKNDGASKLTTLFPRMREAFGELEYHHSDLVEFNLGGSVSLVLHVYARSKGEKGWKDFQLRIEKDQPHRIEKIAFVADVAEPVSLPNNEISDPNTLSWLNRYIDNLVANNDLSGSILIARGDEPLYQREFGFSDAKRTKMIDPETRFNLGSGNKMFTAIAIAQLAEKGKLTYFDPISKYFPDFPDPEFAKKATIHNLLSHTSGINEYWTEDFDKNAKEIRNIDQMLPWVYKVGTDFEPGTKARYCNSNFILAGSIVEKVSGMDYYEYVLKHIANPLNMNSTGFYLRDGSTPNMAEPLRKVETGWERTEDKGSRGTSAGGGYSTARDILKFARGLAGGKLVIKSTLELMTTSKTRIPGSDLDYGYGFLLNAHGGVSSYGHGGITSGVNFEFRYFPGDDTSLIIFNNQDNGAYDDLRKNVTKLISGER